MACRYTGASMMESDWPQRLVEAREIHRAGRLNVARAAYRLLLNAAPEDADVLGLLGVLDLQEGRFGEAEALLRQAVGHPN